MEPCTKNFYISFSNLESFLTRDFYSNASIFHSVSHQTIGALRGVNTFFCFLINLAVFCREGRCVTLSNLASKQCYTYGQSSSKLIRIPFHSILLRSEKATDISHFPVFVSGIQDYTFRLTLTSFHSI